MIPELTWPKGSIAYAVYGHEISDDQFIHPRNRSKLLTYTHLTRVLFPLFHCFAPKQTCKYCAQNSIWGQLCLARDGKGKKWNRKWSWFQTSSILGRGSHQKPIIYVPIFMYETRGNPSPLNWESLVELERFATQLKTLRGQSDFQLPNVNGMWIFCCHCAEFQVSDQ